MQKGVSFGRDAGNRTFGFAAVLLDEICSQQRNVFTAITKRWHRDGNDIQTIVEILPESAGLECIVKISICGRNDP